MDVEIYLAMDGITFEKIGTISMMPPPLFTSIETEEGGATPGSQVRIVGSGFGSVGSTVRVEVDHVASGNDFTLQGVIEMNGEGEEAVESIVFNAPSDIELIPGQGVIDYQCIAEVSVDGSTLTDWQMTFPMCPAVEEE